MKIKKHADFVNEKKNSYTNVEIGIDLHQYTELTIVSVPRAKGDLGNAKGDSLEETIKLGKAGVIEIYHSEGDESGIIMIPIKAGLELDGNCQSNGLLSVGHNDKEGYFCSEIYIAEMYEVLTDKDEDELYEAEFRIYTFEKKADAEEFIRDNKSKSLKGKITKIKS